MSDLFHFFKELLRTEPEVIAAFLMGVIVATVFLSSLLYWFFGRYYSRKANEDTATVEELRGKLKCANEELADVYKKPEAKADFRQLPRVENEAEAARILRVEWMRRMGLDEEEITESLRIEPPASVEAEMAELLALEKLKTSTPSREVLQKIAIKYY